MSQKIRIVGGITANDTRVYDAETGADISGRIRKVTWVHEVGLLPVATVEFLRPDFEGTAEVSDAG